MTIIQETKDNYTASVIAALQGKWLVEEEGMLGELFSVFIRSTIPESEITDIRNAFKQARIKFTERSLLSERGNRFYSLRCKRFGGLGKAVKHVIAAQDWRFSSGFSEGRCTFLARLPMEEISDEQKDSISRAAMIFGYRFLSEIKEWYNDVPRGIESIGMLGTDAYSIEAIREKYLVKTTPNQQFVPA